MPTARGCSRRWPKTPAGAPALPDAPCARAGSRPPPAPAGACAILAAGRMTNCGARTVEPVSGQLKACQKLTTMSRRGLAACENEWLLACAAHNLRKLHRHRLEG
jgi:Transposase DDE domain